MFNRIDAVIKEVGFLMDVHPDEWDLTTSQNTIQHIPSKIKIWIGNEMSRIDFYPQTGSLNRKEKKYLKNKIKLLLCHRITNGRIRSGSSS